MLTQNQQQQKNLGDFILQKVQRKNKLSYQISANLKRRCWSKIECSSSNTLLFLINNQLMSVCFHFSPVSCPFLGPNSLNGVYVSHLLPFIFSIITGTSVINQLSSLDFCGGCHCSFEIILLGYS